MLVNPQQAYKHYKGGIYFILYENALHPETGERLVVYKDGNSVYARPYDMFHGYLEDGRKRFTKVSLSSNE